MVAKTFKNMWIIVSPGKYYDHTTVSYQRKTCIEYFIKDSNVSWKECLKIGWKCIKVNVTITPV